MFRFLQNLLQRLRLSEPLRYKVPVLLGLVFLIIQSTGIEFKVAVWYLLLSLITIVGIAGIAYLLNDWADIASDAAAGKPNALAAMPWLARWYLLVLFLVLALSPWFYFPFRVVNALLLCFEIMLFWAYAFAPFRLKEKALAGVLADALYAHAIPALLATLTFTAIAEETGGHTTYSITNIPSTGIALICLWQFTLGIRNILLHQISDYHNDQRAGLHTFAVRYGIAGSRKGVTFMLAAEVLLFVCMIIFFEALHYTIPLGYTLFVAYSFFEQSHFKAEAIKDVRSIAYLLLDDFYLDWFPLLVLCSLCISDIRFVVVALVYLLLFRSIVKQKVLSYVQ